MATIINNPPSGNGGSGGVGLVVGAIVGIIVIILFFMYGLPALRNENRGGTDINVNVPDYSSPNESSQ